MAFGLFLFGWLLILAMNLLVRATAALVWPLLSCTRHAASVDFDSCTFGRLRFCLLPPRLCREHRVVPFNAVEHLSVLSDTPPLAVQLYVYAFMLAIPLILGVLMVVLGSLLGVLFCLLLGVLAAVRTWNMLDDMSWWIVEAESGGRRLSGSGPSGGFIDHARAALAGRFSYN